ncbi:MAG: methyltransferase domain-containing protein [Phycisphaerae bacterium]
MMSPEEIRAAVAAATWYHAFEVAPGIITPGTIATDARAWFDHVGVPASLAGKAALDIGSWDGPYAFELERRGARVTAVDIQDPDHTGFNTARRILNSNAAYARGSVYDLHRLAPGPFDWVHFRGVFYHLRHPLLAFDRIREVMSPTGQLIFEGECILNHIEANPGLEPRLTAAQIRDSNVPLMALYRGHFKDGSNWHIPNWPAVENWLWAAGLEVVRHQFWENLEQKPFPGQRVLGVARPRTGYNPPEHPVL